MTERERLYERIEVRGPDECWPWQGPTTKGGYGTFYRRKPHQRYVTVPSLVLRLEVGDPEPGQEACHTCDNPTCCNRAHLFWGTRLENMADAKDKGRTASGDRHWSRTQPEAFAKVKENLTLGRTTDVQRGNAARRKRVAGRFA